MRPKSFTISFMDKRGIPKTALPQQVCGSCDLWGRFFETPDIFEKRWDFATLITHPNLSNNIFTCAKLLLQGEAQDQNVIQIWNQKDSPMSQVSYWLCQHPLCWSQSKRKDSELPMVNALSYFHCKILDIANVQDKWACEGKHLWDSVLSCILKAREASSLNKCFPSESVLSPDNDFFKFRICLFWK